MIMRYETFMDKLYQFQDLLYRKVKDVNEELAQVHEPDQKLEEGKTLHLRYNLIDEEAKELLEALAEGDKEHILKEMCDLIYVVVGTAVTFGLPLETAFNRVHENNMQKLLTGTIRPDGKLVKHELHPKTRLKDLL